MSTFLVGRRRGKPRRDVLFFTPYAGPLLAGRAGVSGAGTTGGAETQIFLLARALSRRGWRVAIAAFEVPQGLPTRVEGIEVIRLPAPPWNGGRRDGASWRLRLVIDLWRAADAAVLVQRAAGVATALVGLIARLRGRRFVYSSATVIDFEFDRLERDARAVGLFRIGVRLADRIVVQTDEQAELCRSRWGRRSAVIRSFAEPARQRSSKPEAFLWIGRMAPYKHPEAYTDLAARLPQAQFWMLGTPSPLDPELHERIRAAIDEQPNIELLAPRSRAELVPLFDRAVTVVNTADFEGMPNIFLEGWARGVPALALSHDPDRVVQRYGLGWYANGSPERFAELASAAWAARDDQIEVAQRCRNYVAREHAPDRVAARWEQALGLNGPAVR